MRVGFDGGIKLEFHGAKVTSNGGLLEYRDLDYEPGLFDSVSEVFTDKHTGRNIQHECEAGRCGTLLQWPKNSLTVD